MNKKIILSWLSFIICGFIAGTTLIFFSELIGFSHIGFMSLSWALWFYPLAFIISFGVSGKMFKIKNLKIIIVTISVIFIILFYIIFEGKLFINFIPFKINAY